MSIKILHLLDHSIPIQSGYTFRTRSILLAQRQRGWATAHVTGLRQLESLDTSDVIGDLSFYRTRSAPFQSIPLLNYVGMVWAMKKQIQVAIEAEQPDILHAHSPSLNALATLWANKGRLPIVYEISAFWEDAAVNHGTASSTGLRYRAIRALETYVLRRATAVTTICMGLKNDIVERGIPEDKVTVIANAVNLDDFQFRDPPSAELQEQLGLRAGQKVIGFIGSFYEYEGLDILIEALPLILEQLPDTKLLLIGGEEQEQALKDQVKRMGLEEHVLFPGRVPHETVSRYYSIFDLLIYPRKSMRLTELVTPLKPLEAFAQGKLVALSNVGGHKEISADLFNSISFEADNPQSLSSRVVELLSNSEKAESIIDQARAYVENERTWPAVVANYNPVYTSLVQNPDVEKSQEIKHG